MEQSNEPDANDALIEAYIGPYNKSFYLRAFDKIRDHGQLGWHWPAMFATSGWLLYRKMWLYGFLYIFVLPIVHIILTSLVSAAAGESVGNLFWISTYVVIGFVLVGLPCWCSR